MSAALQAESRPVRCRFEEMAMVSAVPFHQPYTVRTVRPLAEVLSDDFLIDVRQRLWPGHTVRFQRYANELWREVIEIAEARVVTMARDRVAVCVTTAPMVFGSAESGFVLEQDLSGKYRPARVRCDGAYVASFNTAVEAQEYIDRGGRALRSR